MAQKKCAQCGATKGHKLSCELFRRAVSADDRVAAPTIEQIAKVANYTGMSALEVTEIAARNPTTFAIAISSIELREERTLNSTVGRA